MGSKDKDHVFLFYLSGKMSSSWSWRRQLRPIPQEFDMATLATIDREDGPSFILKAVFGFDNFRPMQKEALDSVLGKKDSIALLPTGAGKSIIYTVLRICLKGISIIIQPLRALMEEQVFSLRQKGVTCYFINGSISSQQRSEIVNILTNKYALILNW